MLAPHAARLVVEITEHEPVDDYEELALALKPLRALGVRIAIDDAGAGYASLRHTLALNPDIVKVDISLTRAIDTDRARRALASALISFADEMDMTIVAEGIETEAELRTLTRPRGSLRAGLPPGEAGTAARLGQVVRRSIAQDDPGVVFVKFFISVATAITSAKCANARRCVLATPIDTAIAS